MTNPPPSSAHCLAVILAAGEGTRMKSARPKVLHEVAGRSMLAHVLAGVAQAGAGRLAVVVGPDRADVSAEVRRLAPDAQVFEQRERLGTAHAALCARPALAQGCDELLVVFADTPLIRPDTYAALRAALREGASVAVLGFEARDPTGYGRLLREGAELVAIREHKDASAAERAVTLCNAGVMAIAGAQALALLERVGNDNAQKEFYLTDVVALARAAGDKAVVVLAPEDEVMGVNDRVQLASAEAAMQTRLREAAMRAGVTMIAPQTVFLSWDTQLARDVLIEPHVFFGPGVSVGEGAVIHASSHLAQASVGPGATIGPFARLRPGARIGASAKIGNFVEIKAADIGEGAAVSHLTYLGDATVGARANIGAGTITCNYDGFDKFRTHIGAGAFIGSNSALVAPVTIGDGAYVGSGSVVTQSVAPDSLAIARGRQVEKPGWAQDFRRSHEGKPRQRP
jgi:bifunctional UDP-N-acetylglucosamine pyrophosphorylase/glucosamine-1-phosphate N-acetyltransferase